MPHTGPLRGSTKARFRYRSAAVLAAVAFALVGGPARLHADILVDDFGDGAECGWQQVGDSHFIAGYDRRIVSPGHNSPYALRVQMNDARGWCGVAVPDLSRLNLTGATAIRFFARNAGGCGQLLVDFHQKGGSRWWRKIALPADGSWLEVVAAPGDFSRVEGKGGASAPDFTQWDALWLSLSDVQRPGAAFDLAALAILGAKPPQHPLAGSAVRAVGKLRMPGSPTVAILATPGLPTAQAMRDALAAAGARVRVVDAADLAALLTRRRPPDVTLIDASPVPAELKLPLRRCIDAGKALWYQATAALSPADVSEQLLNAPLLGRHWVELATPSLRLTAAGHSFWPHLPPSLPAAKCSFIPLNDSIYCDTNWPWIEIVPLLTCRYPGSNWISLHDTFTGAVAVLLTDRRPRPEGGGRVLMIGQGGDPSSPFNPASPLFRETAARTLAALMRPVGARPAVAVPAPLRNADRGRILRHDVPVLATEEFAPIPRGDDEYFRLHRQIGFNSMLCGIRWLPDPDANGDVADFGYLDWLMREAKRNNVRVILDPYAFDWVRYRWAGAMLDTNGAYLESPNFHDPATAGRFVAVMRKIAARYRDDPTLCAMMATPHTGSSTPKVDAGPAGRAAWAAYLQAKGFDLAALSSRYGQPVTTWDRLPLPDLGPGKGLDTGPLRSDYHAFYVDAFYRFMDRVIRGIRAEAPDMPLLLRGPWWEVGVSCELASRYPAVAPHCESVETGLGTDAIFRGYALNFGIPVSGENGWPKERGGALRQAIADTLMGSFDTFIYAFAGPRYARPGFDDIAELTRAWQRMASSTPLPARLGLLISDTTLYASRPPSFLTIQARPHLHDTMERLDFPFQSVSAHWPRLAGLSVLLDDGVDEVLTPRTRDKLASWVRAGGVLIGTPITGRLMFDGSTPSLYDALGIDPPAGKRREWRVGKGRVVILPELLRAGDESATADTLDRLLTRFLGQPIVRVRPRVNHCVRRAGNRLYVVAYNKRVEHIGAFFQESRLANVESRLPNLTLSIQAPGRLAGAWGSGSAAGRAVQAGPGLIRCPLAATRWAMIEVKQSNPVTIHACKHGRFPRRPKPSRHPPTLLPVRPFRGKPR